MYVTLMPALADFERNVTSSIESTRGHIGMGIEYVDYADVRDFVMITGWGRVQKVSASFFIES